MKIVSLVLICILILVIFSGCDFKNIEKVETDKSADSSMFACIEKTALWWIVYHKETKAMYAVSYGDYNRGIFTLLVNPDGSPMIYGGN